MNKKGIAPLVIIAILLVAVFGAVAFIIFPWLGSVLKQQCNEMEEKFGLDSENNAWQQLCIDPNNEEIKALIQAQGADLGSLPSDRQSIAQITCHRGNSGFCFFLSCWENPSATIVKSCELGEICSESGQNASCQIPGNCNSNGTCDSGENNSNCPNDCPSACNNNGKCESGENRANCPDDCLIEF